MQKIQTAMSGFKNEQERFEAIRHIKRLDPSITGEQVQSFDDYIDILKTIFPPLPGTPEYEAWIGSDRHKKYMEMQQKDDEEFK